MDSLPVPLHLKIAFAIITLLMLTYLIAVVWYVLVLQPDRVRIIDGVAIGLLIPSLILSVEYLGVFRRDIKTSLLIAIAWFGIALAVGGDLYAGLFSSGWLLTDTPVLLRLITLVAITLVPAYIGLSHLLWWTSLRRDFTRKQVPQ